MWRRKVFRLVLDLLSLSVVMYQELEAMDVVMEKRGQIRVEPG